MSNETNTILRFILRAALTVAPVVAVAILMYVADDPFRVLRHYDTYYPDPDSVEARIGLNKGMVTIGDFKRQTRVNGQRYNAFIFGSSISCFYDADLWASLAAGDSMAEINPFHFDSAGEPLVSMDAKVSYLHRIGNPIDYALIVLDPMIMAGDTKTSPFAIDPPEFHRSLIHTLRYHYTFFRASTNADFLKSRIPQLITGKPVDNGRNPVFEIQPIHYDPLRNQESIPLWDSVIAADPERFYSEFPLEPSPDSITVAAPVLTGDRLDAVRHIAGIFNECATDVHVIISPNRRKIALNPSDLDTLGKLFGRDRVSDYSSSLARRLETDTLLYDNVHYRPVFARELMDSAFRKKFDR